MTDYELFTESEPFKRIVRTLRELDPQFRVMALHASLFWDESRLAETGHKPSGAPLWPKLN